MVCMQLTSSIIRTQVSHTSTHTLGELDCTLFDFLLNDKLLIGEAGEPAGVSFFPNIPVSVFLLFEYLSPLSMVGLTKLP